MQPEASEMSFGFICFLVCVFELYLSLVAESHFRVCFFFCFHLWGHRRFALAKSNFFLHRALIVCRLDFVRCFRCDGGGLLNICTHDCLRIKLFIVHICLQPLLKISCIDGIESSVSPTCICTLSLIVSNGDSKGSFNTQRKCHVLDEITTITTCSRELLEAFCAFYSKKYLGLLKFDLWFTRKFIEILSIVFEVEESQRYFHFKYIP